MTAFEGFQPNSQKTAIPNVFFTRLMPLIKDAAELKIALHVFWALQQKKGSPRFVTFRELLGDKTLAPSLGEDITERVEALEKGLRGVVEKGILITTEVEAEGLRNQLYMLNTPTAARDLTRIQSRDIDFGRVPVDVTAGEARPNIFSLYEDNIGPLTPLVSDELNDALDNYSEEWIAEAIQEAVKYEARSWRYIEAILKKWKTEGRSGGTDRGHTKSREDTDRYFQGRYGHLVRRRFD